MTTTTKTPAKAPAKTTGKAPAKPRQPRRKPMPATDVTGSTSAVDALAGQATAGLQLLQVDPASLKVRDQAREDATPDEQLIASVQKWGIQQPPTVTRDPDTGDLYIVMGHRRVGAAIAAGLTTITVLEQPDATAADAALLERQMIENERRKGLSPAELARGWANLETIFGQTPEDIAAALAESPDRVRAGIRAARSPKAAAVLEAVPALDLEQAAIISEFEDHPDVQETLVDVAIKRPAGFAVEVQYARNRLELAAAKQARRDELAAAGYRVLTSADTAPDNVENVTWLADADGARLTPETHEDCPGRAVVVEGWRIDSMYETWHCVDWEQHGHTKWGAATDPEIAKRNAELAEIAAQQAAAATVRHDWMRGLLQGKGLEKLRGLHDYLAHRHLSDNRWDGAVLALDLLGIPYDGPDWRADEAVYAAFAESTVPALRALVADALGAYEAAMKRSPEYTIRHLETLQAWGYTLSDVDEELLDASRAELDEIAAEAADEAEPDGEDD